MKSIKTIITALGIGVAFLSAYCATAQNVTTYQAYVSNSQTIWQRVIDQSTESSYERALAQYGFLNSTLSEMDDEAFHRYYDETIDLLDELIDSETKIAECKALKSSIYGFELAYNSYKGMFLGPKSSSLISDAYGMDGDNPLVVKLYATSKLYTPEMFGGDPELAVTEFERSVKLFENKSDTTHNWLYLDALAHLGLACQKVGDHNKALTVFKKALQSEPDFGWVKYGLAPSSEKALAAK
ncbi:tetratricopeptide repeat protein [Marinoscillum pacificum]|uniref:tetratricopeptide repeat protein n=1 Tax=Marinoscillum pacificum TaxID=392723 RepID=UPI0021577CAC|nr:tetratricopeptide repeat protein [Marinoscillum pacificum]